MLTVYALLKSIHILMAIIALGANLSYPIWLYLGHKHERHVAFTLNGIKFLDDYIANPGYILSLITGLGLCWYMHLNPFSVCWLWLSLILFALAAGLGIGIYSPLLKKQIGILNTEGKGSHAYKQINKNVMYIGLFICLLALSIIFLMVSKPV